MGRFAEGVRARDFPLRIRLQETDISNGFIIGDWNASVNSNPAGLFGNKLSNFYKDSYVMSDVEHYSHRCAELLDSIELTREAVLCYLTSCKAVRHIDSIRCLYDEIVNCLHCAALETIPITRYNGQPEDCAVRGWDNLIRVVHSEASADFKLWVMYGKPRQGEVYESIKKCRLKFKYIVCKINVGDTRRPY